MRKKVVLFLTVVAAVAVGLWILPSRIVFSKTAEINRPYQVLERNVIDLNAWSNWWPGKRISDSVFEYNERHIRIDAILLNGFQATAIQDRDFRYVFQIVPLEGKRTQITFSGIETAGPGLFNKASGYVSYLRNRSNVHQWVEAVKDYYEDSKKVYGMDIRQTRVTDSVLIALKQWFPRNPSVSDVYDLIYELKKHIAENGGKEDNFPMVNIYRESDTAHLVMVAIATGLPVPATDRYLLKKMELGYILEGEVKGGLTTVKQAEDNLRKYANDYAKTAPAIPYQLWVTNRLQQPDTTQWITKLYYPIFY